MGARWYLSGRLTVQTQISLDSYLMPRTKVDSEGAKGQHMKDTLIKSTAENQGEYLRISVTGNNLRLRKHKNCGIKHDVSLIMSKFKDWVSKRVEWPKKGPLLEREKLFMVSKMDNRLRPKRLMPIKTCEWIRRKMDALTGKMDKEDTQFAGAEPQKLTGIWALWCLSSAEGSGPIKLSRHIPYDSAISLLHPKKFL